MGRHERLEDPDAYDAAETDMEMGVVAGERRDIRNYNLYSRSRAGAHRRIREVRRLVRVRKTAIEQYCQTICMVLMVASVFTTVIKMYM